MFTRITWQYLNIPLYFSTLVFIMVILINILHANTQKFKICVCQIPHTEIIRTGSVDLSKIYSIMIMITITS